MEAHFILSKSKVLEQYDIIKNLCDEVSYSFKTNTEVGMILERYSDSEFSVHSIENAGKIKDKERIWLFPQGWDKEQINLLLEKGIRKFVIDNEPDLDMLIEFISNINNNNQLIMELIKDNKIDIMLRMRMKENTVHTGRYFVFGMYSEKINKLIPELRKNKNIGKLGIHFHRKTQNVSEWSIKYEIEQVIDEKTLECIDALNIGGGFPSKYRNYRSDVMENIKATIKETRDWLNIKGIKLIIEPGRFIAASPVELKAKIKSIYDNNIIINASVYNSCMDTFISNIKLMVEGELNEDDYKKGNAKMYTIKGDTPCSIDIFRYRVYLDNLKKGDIITFLNAGAYNFRTDFCNLIKLKTVIKR